MQISKNTKQAITDININLDVFELQELATLRDQLTEVEGFNGSQIRFRKQTGKDITCVEKEAYDKIMAFLTKLTKDVPSRQEVADQLFKEEKEVEDVNSRN